MSPYFAQTPYGNVSDSFQQEMQERRRIGDTVKEIEGARATITTALLTFYRHVQWAEKHRQPIPETAFLAVDRLLEARRIENDLFADFFHSVGISERLGITDGNDDHADNDDVNSRYAHLAGEELKQARARDKAVHDTESKKKAKR